MRCSALRWSGNKLWGGRFTGATDPIMERFNASLSYDKRLWRHDIRASQAYAVGLSECGILTRQEADAITEGLTRVGNEWEDGTFAIKPSDEDIHTANERRLSELIGSAIGGKLHTGRSRNDQVAVDVRLWLRDQMDAIATQTLELIHTAAARAEEDIDVLMPGYTHLQRAQPVRWSHWMLAHAWSWSRDLGRIRDARARLNESPLGSGAISGHPFNLNREKLAASLGFARPTNNSMDSVSDRDFILEFLAYASVAGVHLSRFAEDLIVFSTKEFGFVQSSDAYSTGSSLMPQKKNPDALELLRGKAGRPIGHLLQLCVTMKGLPLTYNKDMQEDKEPLFDAVDTTTATLAIARGVLSTLKIDSVRMRAALSTDMLATDLAEYLVRRGVPFRETHHIAGAAVKAAEQQRKELSALSLAELQAIHPKFEADVAGVFNMEACVDLRTATGGTSRKAVLEQISKLKQLV
jgi:argininosuccinate lyase